MEVVITYNFPNEEKKRGQQSNSKIKKKKRLHNFDLNTPFLAIPFACIPTPQNLPTPLFFCPSISQSLLLYPDFPLYSLSITRPFPFKSFPFTFCHRHFFSISANSQTLSLDSPFSAFLSKPHLCSPFSLLFGLLQTREVACELDFFAGPLETQFFWLDLDGVVLSLESSWPFGFWSFRYLAFWVVVILVLCLFRFLGSV